MTTPQAPPVRWCTISSARLPSADAGPEDPRHQVRLVEAAGAGHGEADAGEHGADDGRIMPFVCRPERLSGGL